MPSNAFFAQIGSLGGSELSGCVSQQGDQEFLLGPEIVVERRNIYARVLRNVTGAQPLESMLGHERESCIKQCVPTVFAQRLVGRCDLRVLDLGNDFLLSHPGKLEQVHTVRQGGLTNSPGKTRNQSVD